LNGSRDARTIGGTLTGDPHDGSPRFATTHWSIVVGAGSRDTAQARESLSRLCQAYWFPLYAYVRRRGHAPGDAQDLTQAFFARLLEKNWVAGADRSKGKFRTFLLSAMKHFLADQWDRARAQKRGGGATLLPLSLDTAEERYVVEPSDPSTPESIFERRWALALLDTVLDRLKAEYEADGRGALFAALRPCLVGERTAQPYAELAQSLDATEAAIKSAVHRLRQRYRQLLRNEIASTLDAAEDVDDELRHLFAVLSAPGAGPQPFPGAS
jgi:RNA polymerase sigma-70 factor (ECF subfamily)